MPATLLGSYSISPYDVTKLYQTIANQGGKIELSTIQSIADRQREYYLRTQYGTGSSGAEKAAYQTLPHAIQQTVGTWYRGNTK